MKISALFGADVDELNAHCRLNTGKDDHPILNFGDNKKL